MGFTLGTRESTRDKHVTRETLNVTASRFHQQGNAQLNEALNKNKEINKQKTIKYISQHQSASENLLIGIIRLIYRRELKVIIC